MPSARLFKFQRSPAVPTSRLPALRETAAALLRALSAGHTRAQELARIVALDPVLVFELLQATPLTSARPGPIVDALAERLDPIDTGLLQAWALRHLVQQPRRRLSDRAHRHHALHSLFVAELAIALAREMAYPYPDEAHAAGLMHDLGLLWTTEYGDDYPALLRDAIDEHALAVAEWDHYGLDHAELSSGLATRCGFAPGVVDAIALHHADPGAIATAHPLVRIVAAAEELACYRGSQSAASLATASQLSGIDGRVLVSLLADTAPGMQAVVKELEIVVEPAMLTLAWDSATAGTEGEAVDSGIARSALAAFSRSAFADAAGAQRGFEVATRLLLGLDAPVLFVASVEEEALVGTPNPAHPGLEQLSVSTGDTHSVLAEAFRSGSEARYQNSHRPPGRCATDWQLARWLASDGLLCVPWRNAHEAGVAVFPCPSTERPGRDIEPELRRTVTAAATARLSAGRADERMRSDLEDSIARRYVDHARRVAHEASNPLTVIKTYLGIIDERLDDPALKSQLALLGNELDRIGTLVRKATDLSAIPPPEPAHSGVAEILHDLRALYGEALFARKGVVFDLRTTPNLPAAAIPPDMLKQVFLNLFKNAATAIPEGGKLSVSTLAGINANGRPCLEVRIVDNGPGLPPERVATLFSAGPPGADKSAGGVGLPLVRELIASVGGTIMCRSQPGAGTVFQILIPLAAAQTT